MHITHLRLDNYKNLNCEFGVERGLNLVIAPNGVGKTNLLESIGYLAEGSSFRGISDDYVFPQNSSLENTTDATAISVQVEAESGKAELRILWDRGQGQSKGKSYAYNGKKTSLPKLKRYLKTLVHAPTSMDVVAGAATLRRDFLDRVMIDARPGVKASLAGYKRSLRQKNVLLKAYQAGKIQAVQLQQQLVFWNEKIVVASALITSERVGLLQAIFPLVKQIATDIYSMGDYELDFAIESKYFLPEDINFPIMQFQEIAANGLKQKILVGTNKEMAAGKSLYGAHRDNYEFFLNGNSLRFASSRGQQRLFSLILHLAVLQLLNAEHQERHILLLDDIFSELDPAHRRNTINYLKDIYKEGIVDQIFITSPDNRDFPKTMLKKNNDIHLLDLVQLLESR